MMTQRSVPCFQPMGNPSRVALVCRAVPACLLLLAWLILPGCGLTKPTRVLLVGGAGLSQLGDLGMTISAMCPDADVVETGGWDGFRADVKRFATDPPCQGVILIGHSFGCATIAEAAAQLRGVDLVVMIDPAWDDITLPRSASNCMWYQRANDGGMERRAVIRNGGQPMVVAGDHNDICRNPRLIAEVARAVRDISERRAMQQRMRSMVR